VVPRSVWQAERNDRGAVSWAVAQVSQSGRFVGRAAHTRDVQLSSNDRPSPPGRTVRGIDIVACTLTLYEDPNLYQEDVAVAPKPSHGPTGDARTSTPGHSAGA